MTQYGRENTINPANISAAGAAVVVKLPNGSTGALGTQTGGIKAIGSTQRWRIRSVIVSYSAAPAAGMTLTITDGVTTWTVDVNGVGPFILNPLDLQFAAGAEVDITLSGPGTTVIGRVNAAVVSES